MEPQIQYAKTEDGVSIAYASVDQGPPIVRVSAPGMSHVQRLWALRLSGFQTLARAFRLIWYDSRGTGLSRRETGGSDGSPNQLR